MVVAAGEARRGKSSLLNALLNEKESLFPVDVNVCTNVVTVVRYGESEVIEAYIEDPKAENGCRVEWIGRDQIADFVSEKGNPDNYKQVRMLSARVPNGLLKEGVVFVDTPGVGSLNIEHAETTYSFLPNADVLLFVCDADSGLTESELDFLKRGSQYCKNILFPLTKKDLHADYAAILEDDREKISKTLNLPAEDIQIIPVSSTAKLRYLKNGSASMLANSNYPALEDAIWTSIARHKGEILLLPFLTAVKDELLKQMDSVAAQYQVLGVDQKVAQELIDELDRKTAELEELQEKGADWRGELSYFFSVLQSDISAYQREIGVKARNLVDSRIQLHKIKICKKKNYTQLVSDINGVIGQGVVDIRKKISERIEEETANIQQQFSLGINVNQDALEKIGFVPSETSPIRFAPKKKLDVLVGKGREISMNMMGGGRIGMILGGAVAAVFGGPIVAAGAGVSIAAGVAMSAAGGIAAGELTGTLLGGVKGCIGALSKYDNMDVNTVSKTLNQYISDTTSGMNHRIGNTIAELRLTLPRMFEHQLKRQIKELKENIAKIQEEIRLAGNDIPKRRAVLEAQSAQLKQRLAQCEELERSVGELDQASGTRKGSPKPTGSAEISYGFL